MKITKFISIGFFLLLSTIFSFAQDRQIMQNKQWRASVGASMMSNNLFLGGFAANLSVGKYIGAEGDMSVDLFYDTMFSPELSDVQLVGALVTFWDNMDIGKSNKFYTSTSIGLGIITNTFYDRTENADINVYQDFFNPSVVLGLETGYHITNSITIGVTLMSHLNIVHLKENSFVTSGIKLGFKF